MESIYYIPGDEPKEPAPLARYLPPIPEGIAAAFLAGHSGQDEPERDVWIMDPFGASPSLAVEIAANGYRTLVAVNNPVTRFLFEMAANPPSQTDLPRRPVRTGLRRAKGANAWKPTCNPCI